MLSYGKAKRKVTGGRRHTLRRSDRVLSNIVSTPTETTLLINGKDTKEKRVSIRVRGGNKKVRAKVIKNVNLNLDGKDVVAELVSVSGNDANLEYIRRNIITKGAKIKVKYSGKEYMALVKSRPGQAGTISAVKI